MQREGITGFHAIHLTRSLFQTRQPLGSHFGNYPANCISLQQNARLKYFSDLVGTVDLHKCSLPGAHFNQAFGV
jgi:hypothetical protein